MVTAGQEGYEAALDLLDAGVEVRAVLDLRVAPAADPARAAYLARGGKVRDGCAVREALPGRAGPRVEGVTIESGTRAGESLSCDLLLTAVGMAPLGGLACHVGARLVYRESAGTFVVEGAPAGVRLAGAVNQQRELAAVLADGAAAGAAAARDAGLAEAPATPRPSAPEPRGHTRPIFQSPQGKDFVDLDEDQTVADC